MAEELRNTLVGHLDRLNKIMSDQRKAQVESNSLKAEIATINAKLALSDKQVSNADFARLVERAVDGW